MQLRAAPRSAPDADPISSNTPFPAGRPVRPQRSRIAPGQKPQGVVQRAHPYLRAGRAAETDDDELTRRHDEHDLAPGPERVVGVRRQVEDAGTVEPEEPALSPHGSAKATTWSPRLVPNPVCPPAAIRTNYLPLAERYVIGVAWHSSADPPPTAPCPSRRRRPAARYRAPPRRTRARPRW